MEQENTYVHSSDGAGQVVCKGVVAKLSIQDDAEALSCEAVTAAFVAAVHQVSAWRFSGGINLDPATMAASPGKDGLSVARETEHGDRYEWIVSYRASDGFEFGHFRAFQTWLNKVAYAMCVRLKCPRILADVSVTSSSWVQER